MNDKPFRSIKEQIKLLEDNRHLTILDKELAENALKRYGYYEIINGYKTPFLIDPKDDDLGYKEEATFEHIYGLYTLDRKIRESVLQGTEQFEQTFKQILAYTISEEISDNQNNYTAKSHYNKGEAHYNKKGKFKGTDRDRLLLKFTRILKSSNQPYKHYIDSHGNMPPWILVKGLMFGEAVYWYKLSKPIIRKKVISKMLNIDISLLQEIDHSLKISQAFGDILSLCLSYRNLTAHGGRVYNHRSSLYALKQSKFIYREGVLGEISTKQFKNGERRSSLGTLIQSLSIFENKDPYLSILVGLSVDINSYLKKYPEDKEMLEIEIEFPTEKLLKLNI